MRTSWWLHCHVSLTKKLLMYDKRPTEQVSLVYLQIMCG